MNIPNITGFAFEQRKFSPPKSELLLSKETYNIDRLRNYAKHLAHVFKTSPQKKTSREFLDKYLIESEDIIKFAHKKFMGTISEGKVQLPSSSEWIIDNFYLIQDQITKVRDGWKPGVYNNLPALISDPYLDDPRVFAISIELINHTDNTLDEETLVEFLNIFQKITPLSTVEIWTMPNMLKLALLINIRNIVQRDLDALEKQDSAKNTAEKLLKKSGGAELEKAVKKIFQPQHKIDPDFVIYLLQRLRDAEIETAPSIRWIEERIAEQDIDIDEFIRLDIHYRASNRISIGNAVNSLRKLSSIPWANIFEQVSPVEKLLRQDPAGIYEKMDFITRDRYRHVIEELSKQSKLSEQEIVRRGIELARQQKAHDFKDLKKSHIGYFLISHGLKSLKKQIPYSPSFKNALIDFLKDHPTYSYLTLISVILSILISAAFLLGGMLSINWLVITLFIITLSTPAITIANTIINSFLPPNAVSKIDLKDGIPHDAKTVVVIPCLIKDEKGINHLIEILERHYLSNREENLYFALLSDYTDSKEKETEEDKEVLEMLIDRIAKLSAKYPDHSSFYLFHRERLYNENEKAWMGWERKRGKLIEFNRLLTGAVDTSYTTQIGDVSILSRIKYVITLDVDTQFPINTACRLVGAMIHPLNIPVIDEKSKIVTDGYGIVQPMVSIEAPSAVESWFACAFVRESGMDHYSGVVSEIYQDVFGSSIYSGKAIYSVEAFKQTIQERFPQNHLLSHDLIEGAYMRVGLASDIELLEDYPSGFMSFLLRQHRWIRGDWQILDWLFPKVPTYGGKKQVNPIRVIDRWKIFDNLRRSIFPVALTVLVALSWIMPDRVSPLMATSIFLFSLLSGPLLGLINVARYKPQGENFSEYMYVVCRETFYIILQSFLRIAFTLQQGLSCLDAVGRVYFRKLISGRKLLEWTTAADTQRSEPKTAFDYYIRMNGSPTLAVIFFTLILLVDRGQVIRIAPYAGPFLFLWLISPLLAYFVSKPIKLVIERLTNDQEIFLHAIAGRIWRFYCEFSGDNDNHIPADNYQASPGGVIAHRTSPTNIGMYLTSLVSAYDMGYIGITELNERLGKTFQTLTGLLRYKGHFYNWYDTKTLQPLNSYISTVDSGNFAACLITIRQTCIEISHDLRDPKILFNGMQGILHNLQGSLTSNEEMVSPLISENVKSNSPHSENEIISNFSNKIQDLLKEITEWQRSDIDNINEYTAKLLAYSQKFRGYFSQLTDISNSDKIKDVDFWIKYFDEHINTIEEEFNTRKLPKKVTPIRSSFAIDRKIRTLLLLCAREADLMVKEMDFDFLLNKQRKIFHIGFNQSENKLDNSFYDLLASEARIASYVSIAEGQVPSEHWFKLSRPLTRARQTPVLLSWGGTMFEYLMPTIFMKDYRNTLLHKTIQGVIEKQIKNGLQKKSPWGISESAFYAFDFMYIYQYKMFGISDLSLKVELAENLVISPYSTFLALPHAPKKAYDNIMRLKEMGGYGPYGYYESIDLTKSRIPENQQSAIVYSYFAHHQGMAMSAINNYLNNGILQNRFHKDPYISSAELILQEKIPMHVSSVRPVKEEKNILRFQPVKTTGERTTARIFKTANTLIPRAGILSNGDYSVFISNSGSGYSKYKSANITLYQEDATLDNKGMYFYIRDVDTNNVWSSTYQPTAAKPSSYEANFSINKIEFKRQDYGISTTTEIFVAPGKPLEIRKITLSNYSKKQRTIEVASYAEVALDTHRAVKSHPAFSKLFVETDFIENQKLLIYKRRPRTEDQSPRYAFHTLYSNSGRARFLGYETDRMSFIGRGRSTENPKGIFEDPQNSTGAVLDPIMNMKHRMILDAGETISLISLTGYAENEVEASNLISEFSSENEIDRFKELARIYSQIELQHLGISEEESTLFQKLCSRIMFPDPSLKASSKITTHNTKGQSGLFAYGISGDNKIVVVKVNNLMDLKLVRQVLLAHEYLRLKNFVFDLVIIVDNPLSYTDELSEQVHALIESSLSGPYIDKPGGIFLRKSNQMPDEDLTLLYTVARLILDSEFGDLSDHINLVSRTDTVNPPETYYAKQKIYDDEMAEDLKTEDSATQDPQLPVRGTVATQKPYLAQDEGITMPNGYGNFVKDGNEYVINLDGHTNTPLPWSNIIANSEFGTMLTESGLGYSWAINSQMNKITPWSNDPVSDTQGEIIYIKDESTGKIFTPTALPIRETEPYRIRHGKGYSIYEHESNNVMQRLAVFVPMDYPVKVMALTLKNMLPSDKSEGAHLPRALGSNSDNIKDLSAFIYMEPVQGVNIEDSRGFIKTKFDRKMGALFIQNIYNEDFKGRTAFISSTSEVKWATTNRREFLGRNGRKSYPQILATDNYKTEWKGTVEEMPADACAVLETRIKLLPGQEREIIFFIGEAENRGRAEDIVEEFKRSSRIKNSFINTINFWDKTMNTIQVETPSKEFNILTNEWLVYQILSCRYWGRTSFYQAGGAYGFRDQLQDVLALIYSHPRLAREQILRASAHQFLEGDVMHWWHAPKERGVRTKISDDLLWLPYVVSYYVNATGDTGILDEEIPYIKMPLLSHEQEDLYGDPEVTIEKGTIYDHCLRAINYSLKFGQHGLPLIGTGDWNDGLNSVGDEGRGESVWLGWFICYILNDFASICKIKNDEDHIIKFAEQSKRLKSSINENAWDGNWYKRAFFDNGKPLGSKDNEEGFIDSISQSCGVISKSADADKAESSMKYVEEYLVKEDEKMILLLTKPFNTSHPFAGYIQGYLPGIRENGGQYTHAAIWVMIAYACMGNGKRAVELFDMLNPMNHSNDLESADTYKLEPYVIAADIYSNPNHMGRGGWSWYTGSASWMYSAAVEYILGFKLRGDHFVMEPVIPDDWPGFNMSYVYRNTKYKIKVTRSEANTHGLRKVKIDGVDVLNGKVMLVNDEKDHEVEVVI